MEHASRIELIINVLVTHIRPTHRACSVSEISTLHPIVSKLNNELIQNREKCNGVIEPITSVTSFGCFGSS